jgi:hypothetical protein
MQRPAKPAKILQSLDTRKTERNYVMTKLTPTLTQSGLLAVAHTASTCVPPFGVPSLGRSVGSRRQGSSTIPPSPLSEPSPGTLESFTKPIAMSHQIHTYTELQQQIHDDLRIEHPEWVKSDGDCPTCHSYESRLMELLDPLTRTGSNESIAATHRALEHGVTGR